MPADIFDQVASGSGDSGAPDIFDQVAQQQTAAAQDASNVAIRDLNKSPFSTGVTRTRAATPASALPPQPQYQKLQPGQETSLQSEASGAAGTGEMNPRDVIRASAQPKYNAPPAPTLSAPQTTQATNAEAQAEKPMQAIPMRNFALNDEDLAEVGSMQPTAAQQEQLNAERDESLSGMPMGRERLAMGIATGSGLAAGPRQDVKEIGSGIESLGEANRDRDVNALARGGTQILSGAMGLGTPLFAAGAASAPVRAGLYYLAGVGAGKVAGAAAKEAGLTPDEQEFWNTAAFFVPNALTGLAGVEGVRADLGDRGKMAGVRAFGGRVAAGVYRGPEETGGGVRVGSHEVTFKTGGNGAEPEPNSPAALPQPAQMIAHDQTAAAADALAKADALDAAAKNVTEGKPPVPAPPKPPMPDGMEQGVLKPETVQQLASAISMAPPETRPQLVMEAHQNLADWISQHGKVMGPDGKIAIAKTPEQGQAIAAKWINDEVARQDAARNQARAKIAEQQKTEKSEPENQPSQQPPTLQQRAQTIIEANEKATPDALAKTLVKQLGVPYADGKKMVQDARQGKAANIETGGTAIAPEAKKAIDDQVADLNAGRVKAVRLPQDSKYVPALPDGLKRVDVRQGEGAGTYIYDPQQVKAATIKAAAKAGTHEDLLALNVEEAKPAAEGSKDVFDEVQPHSYGNTQAAIPEGSEAHTALAEARSKIDKKDLIATGYGGNDDGLETEPHVTLRYGLKGDDTTGIRGFLEKQAPFEATLGKTTSFPPSKSSEGGAPIIAPVDAPELRRIEAELDKHGDFIDRTFPEYKPHATLGYVKPEAAKKYEGMTETEGKRFPVKSIEISHRDGTKEVVPLKGQASERENNIRPAEEGAAGPVAEGAGAGAGAEAAATEKRSGEPESALAPEQRQPIEHIYEAEVSRYAGDPDARVERIQAENRRHAESLLAAKFPGERIGSAGRVTEVPAETMPANSERKEVAENRQSQEHGAGQPEQGAGALEKGARVSFTDRSGNEHTGTVAHTDGRIARIKAEDKKSYTVAVGRVKPIAAKPEEEDNNTNGAGEGHPASLAEAGGGRPAAGAGGEDRERLAEVPAVVLPTTGEGGNAETANSRNSPDVRGNAASVPEPGAEPGPGAGSDTGIDHTPGAAVAEKATRQITKPKALNKGWYAHPEDWKPPTGTVGRLDANLKAIRILRDIEKNPRKLTEDERDALANYVGWGALPNAFAPYLAHRDEQPRWRKANEELTRLLSPEELARAQESTKNAHYTSPELVRFMWDTMARLGFKAGNVLEPAVGTGNFLGMMPKSVRNKVNAIVNEMDTVSYGIMRLLYPEATAFNKDFADLILPDNDVDLAIGNPPFGGYKLYDPAYKKLNALVHDFFFVKSLDKVRPGGVLAFITSTGTMDKQDANIRNILASKADFLGAIRLPSGAFKANAGTDVTTDLIFLQKRAPGQEPKHADDWLASTPMEVPNKYSGMEKLHVNQYFQAHPEMMLGKPTASSKMYGGMGFVLEPHDGGNIIDLLKEAQKKLPRGIYNDPIQEATGSNLATTAAEFAPDNIKENQFTINEKGQLKQRVNGKLVNPEATLDKAGKPVLSKIQRIKALVGVRDSMNQLLFAMTTQPDDEEGNRLVADWREQLQDAYDSFVKKYGYINGVANNVFRDDPHYPRLLALETWDKAARKGTPADIFRRRTIFPRQELSALPDDPKAALQLVLAERGFPDVAMMARLKSEPVDAIVKTLQNQGLIYRNPASGNYETRETYLSGYVRDKLRDATRAVKQGMKEYEPNVAALEKVVPADIEIGADPATSVSVRLGSTWIPTEAIQDFIRDEFNSPGTVKYTLGNWSVDGVRASAEAVGLYSTPRADADWLLEQTLNQKQATIYDKNIDGSQTLNADATTAAQAAQEKIRKAFSAWAVKSEWKPELQRLYNDAYNNLAQVEYDGSHLTFPGMNPAITLKPHQVNAIWRVLQDGRALLAHEVGAGKTFEMAAAIMEGRRVGTFKKPMLTVPNHIVEQFRQEFLHLYPGANLLVPTEQDFDAKNRQRIISRIATGDFDAIILPHSQFNLMDISPERQRVTIQAQKEELRQTIQSLKAARGEKRTVKQLETAMAKLDASLKKLADLKADKAIYFDDTGVDALFVDEAHLYKNLSFYTKMTRIAGLQQAKAKSALRLKMKTEYLQDRNSGRGVIFATGTPIQNTMAELYTMIKYVAPDVLEKAGIRFFDDWAANFGSVITAMELSADGRSYKARSKFAQFQNVPELMNMFRSFADVKTAQDLDLPKPELETGRPIVVPVPASPMLEDFVAHLMKRAESVKGGAVNPKIDNMLKITTDGRKAATDMRLIDPEFKDAPDSKINTAVEKIYQEWLDGKDDLPEGPTTQMAFLDLYRSIAEAGGKETELINLYSDMRNKLVKLGVPREQIAVIGEHDTRIKRQNLFAAMNRGEVRILFGSTQKMGAGTNAQRLMKALHHIDLTWRPGDLAQRNGRIERQGNLNKSVREYNYLTERSFDAYMAQTLQGKAEFIAQIMSGRSNQRVMSDVASEMVLSLEEMKIAASGNPDVKLQYDLQMQKAQLESLARSFASQQRMSEQEAWTASQRADRYQTEIEVLTRTQQKIAAIEGTGEEKGIKVEVDGKTFTDRKALMDHLDSMDVPPGNFHLTWNGIGISVDVVPQSESMKKMNVSGVQYLFEYESQRHYAPKPEMLSLARSIESRLRQIPDDLEAAKVQLPKLREKATRLREITENGEFPEANQLTEVTKQLHEVEKRLGMRSDVENAMAQAVSAEVADDPEDDLLAEAPEPDETEDVDERADQLRKMEGGGEIEYRHGGLGAAAPVAQFAADQLAAFWKADVAPHLGAFGEHAREAGAQIVHLLYPRLGANQDAQDILGRARGKLEAHLFQLETLDGGLEKFFDRMPVDQQIDFIDRYKQGQGQKDPTLQRIESIMRRIDDASLREAQQYKPTLTAKENHFRVIWKVIPFTGDEAKGKSAQFRRSKRPWQGDKGFMRRSTLETISEGIAAGGVPVSTNPWKLFTLAQASMMKYISAQDAWADAKQLGLRKFVKRGQTPPEGWIKINDRIADVYFPEKALSVDVEQLPTRNLKSGKQTKEYVAKEDLETHRVMANPGSWYAEPGFGRLLNNYLSPDLIRQSAIGSALVYAKNLSTAIELGVSPFHAIFETLEAMGSQFGLGVQRVWNNGVRLGEGAEVTRGMKEIATSVAAPYLLSHAGGSALEFAKNPAEFAKTPRGKEFFKHYPEAGAVMQELFDAGLTWGVQRDFRFDPEKSMIQAAREGNYVGAVLRAVPWMNTVMMKPLFEAYIPRLKWGLALQQFSQQIIEHAAELGGGELSRGEVARRVVDTVENRFGEMNFNNVYWNNTFKSALQILFRSVTWKLGNWRGLTEAVGRESYDAFRDPLKAMREDAKAGNRSHRFGEYLPKVGMNQAWLLGIAFTTAVLGTILARFWTHKWPWELASEDREEGYSLPGAIGLEVIHPRTGRVNQYTGKPERLSMPTGMRDFEHAYRDPRGYVKGSLSGMVSRFYDTLENRDAFKNYVYDPNAPEYQKLAEIFAYNMPKPISVENFTDTYGPRDVESKLLRAAGVGKASSTLDMSPAEMQMHAAPPHIPLTPEQIKERDYRDVHPTHAQVRRAMRERNLSYVQRLFKGLPYKDARDIYDNYANEHERRMLGPILREKRQRALQHERR